MGTKRKETSDFAKVETYKDLYSFMRIEPGAIKDFISFISNEKWVLKTYKIKPNRITMHISNRGTSKPLYLDENMCMFENGMKAAENVQEVIRERIDIFIIQYFGERNNGGKNNV